MSLYRGKNSFLFYFMWNYLVMLLNFSFFFLFVRPSLCLSEIKISKLTHEQEIVESFFCCHNVYIFKTKKWLVFLVSKMQKSEKKIFDGVANELNSAKKLVLLIKVALYLISSLNR